MVREHADDRSQTDLLGAQPRAAQCSVRRARVRARQAHRELDEEAQERVDEVQSKLRELQEDASLAQEGAAARRRGSGRKKVEDVDAAAVAIQRTLRGKRGRARARASKG